MADHYRIHPLVRAYGKARIEITRQAKDEQEWQKQWRVPQNPFSFRWGNTWKQCVEYKVEDFASEVGFFIDLLGFLVHTFSPSYARLTTPDEAFYFAISEVRPGEQATPTEALRLQFCVIDLEELALQLESRGISIEVTTSEESSGWMVASFRTPHGIFIDLVDLTEREVFPDETSDIDSGSDTFENLDAMEMPEEDWIDDSNAVEDDIQIETEIDPVELVLRQQNDDQEEDNLSPFIKSYPNRRESPAERRPRIRSAPRINNFNFNDLKRIPPRDEKPIRSPNKPRENGEITYVKIEDEDEL